MQENEPVEQMSHPPAAQTPARGPAREGRAAARHTPYLVAGLVAVLGLGMAGLSAATVDSGRSGTVAAGADQAARSQAAQRADRAERETAGTANIDPGATPATSPTAAPSASGTPSAAAKPSAAPKRPTTAKSSSTAKAARSTPAKPATGWVNPMPGAAVTSCFGMRWGVLHAGIDLAMPAGTSIRAAAAGTVVEAGWAYTGYGISVVIDHGNGYLTHYAHQSRTAVSVGQRVTAGAVIGYEGATGDVTGPHLHFEVHNGLWNQVDPAPWLRARGVDLGC